MGYWIAPTRRQFLALAATAGLLATERGTRWALLADTHISADPTNSYRGFRPYENLQQIVPQILKAGVDGVLIAGDLARLEGLPGDYQNLAALLEPVVQQRPVALALGNHDDRENFLRGIQFAAGLRQEVPGKFVTVVEAGPVRFILLDSLIRANYTPGLLGKRQRDWLGNYLAARSDKPTVLVVHHTLDDGDNSLLDVLWLLRIVEPIRAVKAILYGHSHAYHYSEQAGIHLINLPATGYNFNDREPVGWLEAEFTTEGAEFELHAIGGNRMAGPRRQQLKWRS